MAEKVEIIIFAKDLAKKVLSGTLRGIKGLAKGAKVATGLMTSMFRKLRTFGLVATASFVGLVKNANDFRKAMAEVATLTASGDVTKLTAQIIDLSSEIGVAKVELVQGLYQALSAGIPENNAIEFLTKAAKAAIGGVASISSVIDASTSVLDAYGLSAKDLDFVLDKMFTTVKNGKINFSQIANKIGQVAGVAGDAGVSLDELFGVMARGSKTVIPEQLFTALRQAILDITTPSTELEKVFKKLGVTGQGLIKDNGLAGAMSIIRKETDGSQAALVKLLPSMEGLAVVLATTGSNTEEARRQIDLMSKSLGASAESFVRMDAVRGWPRLWQKILRPITKIGIVFDKELAPDADRIGKLIDKWQGSDSFKDFLTTIKDTMGEIQTVVEDLFAGGERRGSAIEKIKGVAKTIVDVLLTNAIVIGEKIAIGMVKGTFNVAKKVVGISFNDIGGPIGALTASVSGKKLRAGGQASFVGNLVSGGAVGRIASTERQIEELIKLRKTMEKVLIPD